MSLLEAGLKDMTKKLSASKVAEAEAMADRDRFKGEAISLRGEVDALARSCDSHSISSSKLSSYSVGTPRMMRRKATKKCPGAKASCEVINESAEKVESWSAVASSRDPIVIGDEGKGRQWVGAAKEYGVGDCVVVEGPGLEGQVEEWMAQIVALVPCDGAAQCVNRQGGGECPGHVRIRWLLRPEDARLEKVCVAVPGGLLRRKPSPIDMGERELLPDDTLEPLVQPISSIKAKCTVVHRDMFESGGSDLQAFYYTHTLPASKSKGRKTALAVPCSAPALAPPAL